MRRARSILLKLLLFTVTLLVSGEVALRLAGYAQGPAQFYDPAIGYRFYPGQERVLLGREGEHLATVRTNEMGYRGPWHEGERGEDVTRIVCLGDSFTFGWGVEDSEAYPIVLEELFAGASGGPSGGASGGDVQVVNLGVPGYNTRNELKSYLHHGRALDPDVVVLGYFVNDLQPDPGGPRYTDSLIFQLLGKTALLDAFHKHLRHRTSLFDAGRSEELKRRLETYQKNFALIQSSPGHELAEPYWRESMAALEELVAAVRADGAKFLLVAFPSNAQTAAARKLRREGASLDELPADTFAVQRVLAQQARRLDVAYLDLLEPFLETEGDPFGSFDNSHPGPAGYAAAARAIRARLLAEDWL